MLEAGYPVVCDVVNTGAPCVTCGKPIGRGGMVFYQDAGPTHYCARDAAVEVARLTGGRSF